MSEVAEAGETFARTSTSGEVGGEPSLLAPDSLGSPSPLYLSRAGGPARTFDDIS